MSNKGEKSQIPSSLDFIGFAHKMACSESSCTERTSSSHREQPLQPEKGSWVHNFSMRSQPRFMLSLFQIVALVDISEYSITNSSGGGNCPQPTASGSYLSLFTLPQTYWSFRKLDEAPPPGEHTNPPFYKPLFIWECPGNTVPQTGAYSTVGWAYLDWC